VDVTVADAPERTRYEATTADGEVAGIAQYILDGSTITFVHTKVEDKFEGHGVGSQLAREALRDARRRDLRIVPVCPYIKAYLAKHPEVFDDL